jgi:hypothetical protein
MFPVKPVYSFVYTGPKMGKRKGTRDVASPLSIGSSGGTLRSPPAECVVDPPIHDSVGAGGILDEFPRSGIGLRQCLSKSLVFIFDVSTPPP